MNTTEDNRPFVTDAPAFRYTDSAPDCCRLLYSMPVDLADRIEVIGDPANGGYEWVRRNAAGKIIAHSDCGYGSTEVCMRDGLAAAGNEPSVGVTREMENILRKLVQADQRAGLLDRLRAKVSGQGGHCDDDDAWLIAALEQARAMVMKRNRDCGY